MTVIPPTVSALLELFESSLSDVRFADLDANVLNALAAEVAQAAESVASKQTALDEARAALQERQNLLLQQAQRALAYARVYAENDFDLRAKLEAIALPKPPRAPRRAGTEAAPPPPQPREEAELAAAPIETGSADEPAEPKAPPNGVTRKKKRDGALPATP